MPFVLEITFLGKAHLFRNNSEESTHLWHFKAASLESMCLSRENRGEWFEGTLSGVASKGNPRVAAHFGGFAHFGAKSTIQQEPFPFKGVRKQKQSSFGPSDG